MTAMDKKINELNARMGRKTGIDFKKTGINIGGKVYANKPYLYGLGTTLGLFFFTGAGIIASGLLGAGVYVGKKVYDKGNR